jgi:hypothetical protein
MAKNKKKRQKSLEYIVLEAGKKRFLLDHTNANVGRTLDKDDGFYGLCHHMPFDGIIPIDDTLRGKKYVGVVFHEWAHGCFDDELQLRGYGRKARERFVKKFEQQVKEIIFHPEFLRRAGFV